MHNDGKGLATQFEKSEVNTSLIRIELYLPLLKLHTRRIANKTLKEAEQEILAQASASAIEGNTVAGRAASSFSLAS